MAGQEQVIDWLDLNVMRHWYGLRRQLEHELQAATSETRKAFDVNVRLSSATIASDGDRSVLRVPVSASWRHDLEQVIASVLVTSTREDEPRLTAIAHDVAELLDRWVERDVPVGLAPVFLYPETEARWPQPAAAEPVAAKPAAKPRPVPAGAKAAETVPAAKAATATTPRPAAAAGPASPGEQAAPPASTAAAQAAHDLPAAASAGSDEKAKAPVEAFIETAPTLTPPQAEAAQSAAAEGVLTPQAAERAAAADEPPSAPQAPAPGE